MVRLSENDLSVASLLSHNGAVGAYYELLGWEFLGWELRSNDQLVGCINQPNYMRTFDDCQWRALGQIKCY